ncbi:MAG: hypothetical protein H2045_08870 [Rhizobiales bacterium]|nr:hypothetical protein [Hyphomicrobiales bacterium]
MFLAVTAVLFSVFFGNVVFASQGGVPFLNDVQELIVLMSATAAFVVAILRAEKRELETKTDIDKR